MITPEGKLKELGIELPESPGPLGSYIPCVKTGNLLFLSGILPLRDGKLTRTGKVGDSISLEEAQQDARQIVINALSVIKAYTGSLNKIKRCVKLVGYISSASNFTEQPKILNAASDLLFEIFGEAGRHSRAAVGVNVLPLNSPLEIDFIFEISD
jgi:enamine deaminase RidA (YjgF/YER057c/UK114 family)